MPAATCVKIASERWSRSKIVSHVSIFVFCVSFRFYNGMSVNHICQPRILRSSELCVELVPRQSEERLLERWVCTGDNGNVCS